MLEGIDVSRWQGTITTDQWREAKASGVNFVFIKATEGTSWVDPMFRRNWDNAREAGLLRGAYHFFLPDVDPVRQAQHFLDTVGGRGDLPPVLDVERHTDLGRRALSDRVQAWLDVVAEALGREPMIYTRAGYWNGRVEPSRFGDYDLWVAHYTGRPLPTLPHGWTGWSFWQYTQEGRVPGIRGNVDRNRWWGTWEELMAYVNEGNAEDGFVEYTVEPGDTVARIAHRFGVSPFAIEEANELEDINRIEVGQVLRIPLERDRSLPDGPPPPEAAGEPEPTLLGGRVQQENAVNFSAEYAPDGGAVTVHFDNLLLTEEEFVATRTASFVVPLRHDAPLRATQTLRGYAQVGAGARARLLAHLAGETHLLRFDTGEAGEEFEVTVEGEVPPGVDYRATFTLLVERDVRDARVTLALDALHVALAAEEQGYGTTEA